MGDPRRPPIPPGQARAPDSTASPGSPALGTGYGASPPGWSIERSVCQFPSAYSRNCPISPEPIQHRNGSRPIPPCRIQGRTPYPANISHRCGRWLSSVDLTAEVRRPPSSPFCPGVIGRHSRHALKSIPGYPSPEERPDPPEYFSNSLFGSEPSPRVLPGKVPTHTPGVSRFAPGSWVSLYGCQPSPFAKKQASAASEHHHVEESERCACQLTDSRRSGDARPSGEPASISKSYNRIIGQLMSPPLVE